jgi:hypothetical protein
MKGCTATQDDVARLMSRLRLINGVTRVTLADSLKQDSAQGGSTVASTPASGSGSGAVGCGANAPSFDLVVFFQPLPGAGTGLAGATGPGGPTAPAASSASSSTSTTSSTPAAAAPTPQQQVSTTATSSNVPVSNNGGAK